MDERGSVPAALTDFKQAATAILAFLADRLPFGLWMVTRTDGNDWIVLAASDRGYSVVEGRLFNWSDSFCSRMVVGEGPRIAPRSDEVPAYKDAPIGRQVPIASYIGFPILREDASLFGTLCAIDKAPQPEEIVDEQPLLELLASLLSSILTSDLRADVERRRAERVDAGSLTDELTGLGNLRAWDRILEAEESRCRRYGDPASVLVLGLDELKDVNDDRGDAAGNRRIETAAAAIRTATREGDFAARIADDEFAILLVNARIEDAAVAEGRLANALSDAGVRASIGAAARVPADGLAAAWKQADSTMYEAKQADVLRDAD